MSEKTLTEGSFFQAHEETKKTLALLSQKLEKLEQLAAQVQNRQPDKSNEPGNHAVASDKEAAAKEAKKRKQQEEYMHQFWEKMAQTMNNALQPITKQLTDLQTKFVEAAKPREIIKHYRVQWVESRGVLTIIALVLFLFSAICWRFTAQYQAQENIAYRNIFRVARAYHGASANDLQFLRTVFLEQGHDKERTQLLDHADRYEAQWNALQDSLIRVRENSKIK
ncbi:hypothetical protein SAMN02745202_02471 [Segatella oulorum]|jgi:hypothetical protein|uniref:Uncharacterized protein n=1 Tax=Segatella oulorum TaxID=28136 RepID=A0A1T4RX49_9BACT|nr:hypothetical protein [Segatella oulorum]SKA20532.1 hypothetical protein SAMN02745202_02471 [Segatella oulorum]